MLYADRRRFMTAVASGVALNLYFGDVLVAAEDPPSAGITQAKDLLMCINKDIDDGMCTRIETGLLTALRDTKVADVYVIINCGGGDVSSAIAIYNLFISSGLKIITYNLAYVASAANYIFQAGSVRIANPNSSFMFHPTAAVDMKNEKLSLPEVSSLYAELKFAQSYGESILRDRTRLTDEDIRNASSGVVIVSAQDALKKGVVDEVRALKFPPSDHMAGWLTTQSLLP